MSYSTSATLFYGYVFCDDDELYPWQNAYDYAENNRLTALHWELREHWNHRVLGKTVNEVEALSWEERNKLFARVPVTMDTWGYEYRYRYLRPTDKRAEYTGYGPTTIPTTLTVGPTWDRDLNEFADSMGIDLKGQTPAWILVASYG